MASIKFKLHTTAHRGNTTWSVYVLTNLKHLPAPGPLRNGSSGGRHTVWESFYAPADDNRPEAALAVGLEKIAEFIRKSVELPEASVDTSRAHEVELTIPLGQEICPSCHQGTGEPVLEVWDEQ